MVWRGRAWHDMGCLAARTGERTPGRHRGGSSPRQGWVRYGMAGPGPAWQDGARRGKGSMAALGADGVPGFDPLALHHCEPGPGQAGLGKAGLGKGRLAT